MDGRDTTPTWEIMTNALGQVLRMLRKEAALARHEVTENLGRARTGIALVAGGAALGLVALIALAGAGIAGLVAAGLEVTWAALAVGFGLALIAGVLLAIGIRSLDPERLAPRRAMSNIKRDVAMLQERFNG